MEKKGLLEKLMSLDEEKIKKTLEDVGLELVSITATLGAAKVVKKFKDLNKDNSVSFAKAIIEAAIDKVESQTKIEEKAEPQQEPMKMKAPKFKIVKEQKGGKNAGSDKQD